MSSALFYLQITLDYFFLLISLPHLHSPLPLIFSSLPNELKNTVQVLHVSSAHCRFPGPCPGYL